MARISDKRERLISAANKLILHQGFKQTTLSDIAKDARVPLGNVYYYFKTKEEIGETIVRSRLETTRQWLDICSAETDPRDRLLKFLEFPTAKRAELAANGCTLGTLSYELRRSDTGLADISSSLIAIILAWAEQQFTAMSKPDAQSLALQFTSNMQGMCLISNSIGDPDVIDKMVANTRNWVLSL